MTVSIHTPPLGRDSPFITPQFEVGNHLLRVKVDTAVLKRRPRGSRGALIVKETEVDDDLWR